jgi:DegV family protein with EDD domain
MNGVHSVNTDSRPVHIVVDSTADLTPEWIGDLPITVVPLTVDVEGKSFLDGVNLSTNEFVRYLRSGALPRTSQPSIGAFQEVYKPILDAGYDIVSIHISPKLSGTMNSATQARAALDTDAIHIIDSTTFTMAMGFMAIEAAEMAQSGKSAAEIAAYVEQRKHDQRMFATLETLEYLRKGGRIGRAAAMLGSALQLKPVIKIQDGAVEPVERVRTYKRALQRLSDIYAEIQPFDRLAVLHLDAPDEAARLAERIQEIQPDIDIVTGEIGTVIGTYAGPGLAGFTGLVRSS